MGYGNGLPCRAPSPIALERRRQAMGYLNKQHFTKKQIVSSGGEFTPEELKVKQ